MATTQIVFLAIGSNCKPRKANIIESLKLLQHRFPTDFRVSSLYKTEPYLCLKQSPYYNCCVRFQTKATARELLSFISSVENRLGRKRSGEKWESRSIDVDIVFYGEEIIKQPDLIIPHYDMINRDFFLIPLLELHQTLVNPETGFYLKDAISKIPNDQRTNPIKIEKPAI